MATMTIAQALASTATGIQVVDTPANIAAAATNTSLIARVSSFTMNASGASSVGQAKSLYSLGSKFSRGGYTYTVRDTVAALSDPTAATALTALNPVLSVLDNATNLLAASTSLMSKAVSVVLSANATVNLANLIKLEALPAFSVLPGQVITLADTAGNLLALTAAQNRPSIKVFHVIASGNVTLAQAQTLSNMPSFAVVNNATLTVANGVAIMTASTSQALITKLNGISGVVINVNDTFANLRAAAATLTTMSQSITRFSVTLLADASATAAQIAQLLPLGSKFSVAGKTLTLTDTAPNILSAAAGVTAMVQATKVSQSANITAEQLVALTGLPQFSLATGAQLTVSGTLAALNALTPAQLAFVAAETVRDTITALTAANGMPALATKIVALLDAAQYTAAQAAQLAMLAAGMTLTVTAVGPNTVLTIADTLQNLAAFAPMLTGLLTGYGAVVFSPTNSNVSLTAAEVLSLLSLGSVDPAVYGVSVSDSGATITANAGQLFGLGLAAINVTSGVFAGTLAQLLDPTLHFAGVSGPFSLPGVFNAPPGTPSAQLASNATVATNQLIALSLLPGFSVASGVTLLVQDTAATLAANAALIGTYATAASVTDTAVVTAAQAASLAGIAQVVGGANFSLGGHTLTIADSVAALTNPANAAGVALANALALASDAVATAAQAVQVVGFGNRFSTSGHTLTLIDSAAALSGLAGNSVQLAAVNAWGGQVLLSADVTLNVAGARTLKGFTGFSVGNHHLTISDTAANLLGTGASAALMIATTVQLSADAIVSVAGANTLAGLPSLSLNGHSLTVRDTPTALTGASGGLLLATAVTLADNAEPWVVSAATAARLAMLPGFSVGTAGMAVVDTAANILMSQNADGLSAAVVVSLTADAVISALDAAYLAAMANFDRTSASLTIQDRAGALASLSSAETDLASSIVLQGSGLVSVDQFRALRVLTNLTTDGGTLIVTDSADNLARLAGTNTALADLIILSSNATLTAAEADVLAELPNFVGGGAQISVVDTAANLLRVTGAGTRPDNWEGELIATTVTLSTDATITAAQAAEFATLGGRFSRGGHTLTVADTAANLAMPVNALGLALATSLVLNTSASLSAAQATQLAGMPGLTLGSGIQLTVQDTVANLLSLSAGVQALATAERLAPGASVVVTAQQAAQLVALGHFSNAGATVTVSDTIANLTAVTGWQAAATSYAVVDTLAHLAASAATTLLANAGAVMPIAGGDIGSATAAILAGIAQFSAGGMPITVTDVPAQISANAAAILTIGGVARINATLPISTSEADALVALNTAGKLQTVTGITIAIKDSYAALTNSTHAAGLALASSATVLDTPANVLTATAHNWGTLAVRYLLSAGGTITATQGMTLAALGTNFQVNGQALVMAGTAAAIAGAGATLSALDIVATVTDTTANVVSNASALIARGDRLSLVTLTDSTPVTAAQADRLQYLASVLSGIVAVNDTAVAIGQNLPDVMALGVHLGSVTVTDTAARVTPWVATLQSLGVLLTVSLTDTAPVSAATAVSLLPLLSALASSTSLSVQDTGATLAAQAVSLATFGAKLGTVTLSDGTAVTAAVAAALAPVASHLAPGVQLDVSGTVAQLVAAGAALAGLSTAGRISTLVAANDTASAIVGAASALAAMNATATVRDSGAQVLFHLDNLQALSGLLVTSITLTDLTPPVLTMSVQTLSTDMTALGLITSPFSVAINDTASAIAGGLTTLVGFRSQIASITVSDGGAISLTTTQVAATGVNDGAGSVLAKMTGGTLAITGATIADFTMLDGLTVHATSISVNDTLAHVQADLIAGSSKLLAHSIALGSIAISDAGTHTLTLTVAQLRADAGVLAKISGPFTVNISDSAAQVQADLANPASALIGFAHLGTISFTDAGTPSLTLSVGQLTTTAAVLSDIVTPYRVVVNDTATAVETDLALGAASKILALGAMRSGIFVPTGSTIHLDASVLGVAGMVGALTSMTGRTGLAIADATVAQVSTIYNHGISGTTIAIRDAASAVQGDLTAGTSQLELRVAMLTGITLTDSGTPALALNLTQLGAATTVLAKISTPYQIAVSDTLNAVQTDLALGLNSLILGSSVTSVTVPGGSNMTLTAAQAMYAGVVAELAGMTGLASVTVTGATFDQFSSIVGHGVPGLQVSVIDTAAHLQADLTSVSSKLIANLGAIAAITVSDGASVNIVLSLAQITAASAVLGEITGTYHLTVSDTAANVQADLQAGLSSIILNNAEVTLVALPAGSTITLAAADAVGGAAAALVGATGLAHFVVTGVSVSQIPTILNTGVSSAELQVSDSASNVQGDLALGASSKLLTNGSSLTSIAVSPSSALTLTAAQATYAGVADLISTGITGVTGLVVNGALVTGSTGVAAIAALNVTNTTINVADLAANVQSDLMAGTSTLVGNVAKLGTITFTDVGTPTVTLSLAKLAADGAVLAKMSGFNLAVADTAANIVADLTAGSSVILGPPGVSDVTLTGGTAITLTDAQLTAPVQTALSTITGLNTIFVDATPIANVSTVAGYSIGGKTIKIQVLDTAGNVQSDLTGAGDLASALGGGKLDSVTLSNPSTAINLNVAQLVSGFGVLGTIGSAYNVAITDTAASVAGDLANQATSKLLGLTTHLQGITLSANADLTLNVGTATYAGVAALVNAIAVRNDGTSVIGRQDFVVTGVSVGQIGTVLGLGVSSTKLAISDTAANVQTDLTTGSHDLATNIAAISTITMTGTAVTLTVAQADAGSAVLTKIGAGNVSLTINDTASGIEADLALAVSSTSKILNNAADFVTLSSGSAISLTQAQLAASGVSAAVASITGLTTLHVTATSVAQIDTVSGYSMGGITVDMDVTDTAANIEADLQSGGSDLVTAKAANKLHALTLSDGSAQVIHLDVAQLQAAASVLALIGATPGYTVAVDDASTAIEGDLMLGASSALVGLAAHLGAITLSDANADIDLTAAQALVSGVGAAVSAITNRDDFNVTGATVAQVAGLVALNVSDTYIAVSDTFGNVQTDLTTGSHVLATNDAAISAIVMTGGTAITLTVAQAGAGSAVLTKIGAGNVDLTISDTAANIQADLALAVSNTSKIVNDAADHVTGTDVDMISLTATQVAATGVVTALGKFTSLDLTVTNVLAANVGTLLTSLSGITTKHVEVNDTLANVEAALAALRTDHASIDAITLTDVSTPTFTAPFSVSDFTLNNNVLPLIQSDYRLTVSDTAANVEADLQLGSPKLAAYASHVTSIALTDGGTPTIALTMPQVSNSGAALSKLGASSYVLDVDGTAAELQADLALGASSKLEAVAAAGNLGTIMISGGGTITLTVAQLDNIGNVLSHLGAGTIVISDTIAHIQADLALGASSALVDAATEIASFVIPGGTGAISLTVNQIQVAGVNDGASSAMALLDMAGATLVATNVQVADIAAMVALGTTPAGSVQPSSLKIKDAAATILSDIGGSALIAGSAVTVDSVTTTETTLTAANAATIYNAFTTKFDESGLTITDTAANLLSTHGTTPLALSGAADVTISDNPTNLTAAQATTLVGILGGSVTSGHTITISDTSANLLAASSSILGLATSVTLSTPVTLTAANATLLAALPNFSGAGAALTVQDTSANLLNAGNAAGIAAATTTKLLANETVNAATLTSLSALHGYSAGATSLTVQDTAAHIAGLGVTPLSFAAIAAVSDTVANFNTSLTGLQANVPALKLRVTLTDAANGSLAITTTDAIYAANLAAYGAVTNTAVIKVNGGAANLAAIASQLTTNVAVGEVNVTDTSANILSRLSTLNSMGSKFHSATITDTSVNAAAVASLLSIPNLTATGLTVTDTGAQIAAAIQANAGSLAFLNGAGVSVVLSADSVVDAAGALTLSQLTPSHLIKGSFKIYIWDAASYLTNGGNATALTFADGVYLKAPGNAAQVNAATANTLLTKLSSGAAPSGITAASITVQDTAANLDTSFTFLNANKVKIAAFRVSASATVTGTVLGELQTLGATMASGSLTVRDTSANILSALAAQPVSPSVTPSAWLLSAHGTVATAGAITLAGLVGFSAGSYKLTLSDDATISVANANLLGGIRTSLLMGGHTVQVSGTVATVSALSADAKLIVTPAITDTFANVAALTLGSGLLGGTITISNATNVTVAQAAAFLALIGGSGIPAAKVSFGANIETVSDTLANIQTLTVSSGWTGNATIRAGFHLIVADTVANLINPSNTAALETMYGTTLAANSTVSAAAAQTLFGLTDTINFDKGVRTLTIEDSAANLLNPVNADALGEADAVQLSADDSVNAADAAALLTMTNFSLNHVLTITDNSANLLDPALAGLISGLGGNVIVHLAGAETVDAGTATLLVGLHGFADPGNYLAIADSASYLINPANFAAEHLANTVTLIGDETVSVATAAKLDAVENFSLGSYVLHLASNDYADQAGLKAIGEFNTGFNFNGHTVTVTQDALALTPDEYAYIYGNNSLTMNGHVVSAMLDDVIVTSGSGNVMVNATGVMGAMLKVYAGGGGAALSTTANVSASVSATVAESAIGNAVVITETVNGVESAPIIAIEQDVVTAAAGVATFATSGAVQVDTNKFVDLYTKAAAPTSLVNPFLVYDPNAYTLSLSVNGSSTVLVTLGTATHPTILTADEIFIQHFA